MACDTLGRPRIELIHVWGLPVPAKNSNFIQLAHIRNLYDSFMQNAEFRYSLLHDRKSFVQAPTIDYASVPG